MSGDVGPNTAINNWIERAGHILPRLHLFRDLRYFTFEISCSYPSQQAQSWLAPMSSTEQEERARWFRFSRAVLEVLQPGMRALFIQCFNNHFGPVGFTCTDDSAFGDVFVNGAFGEPSVALPGTISVRQNQGAGKVTDDWPGAGVTKGSRIRIRDGPDARLMEVSKVLAPPGPPAPSGTLGTVTFAATYPGPDNDSAVADLLTGLVPRAVRTDNSAIERHILSKYAHGNTNDWDLTALKMALLGLKSKLMHPLPTKEHHATVATCTVPADYVVAATELRNTEFAHRFKVRMRDDEYQAAMAVVQGFVEKAGLDSVVADGLRSKLDEIKAEAFNHAEYSLRLQEQKIKLEEVFGDIVAAITSGVADLKGAVVTDGDATRATVQTAVVTDGDATRAAIQSGGDAILAELKELRVTLKDIVATRNDSSWIHPDHNVHLHLGLLGLQKYAPALMEKGVKKYEDLALVNDEILSACGFNPIDKRKFVLTDWRPASSVSGFSHRPNADPPGLSAGTASCSSSSSPRRLPLDSAASVCIYFTGPMTAFDTAKQAKLKTAVSESLSGMIKDADIRVRLCEEETSDGVLSSFLSVFESSDKICRIEVQINKDAYLSGAETSSADSKSSADPEDFNKDKARANHTMKVRLVEEIFQNEVSADKIKIVWVEKALSFFVLVETTHIAARLLYHLVEIGDPTMKQLDICAVLYEGDCAGCDAMTIQKKLASLPKGSRILQQMQREALVTEIYYRLAAEGREAVRVAPTHPTSPRQPEPTHGKLRCHRATGARPLANPPPSLPTRLVAAGTARAGRRHCGAARAGCRRCGVSGSSSRSG